jgi:hypothetical protein
VMGSPLMSTVISALLAFSTTLFWLRESLRLGHLALRHQLSVYKQTVHRPRLRLIVSCGPGCPACGPGWHAALTFA